MLKAEQRNRVEEFYKCLKTEIINEAGVMNQVSECSEFDGFSAAHIDEGLVEYRGAYWSIEVKDSPPSLVMTWGSHELPNDQHKTLVPKIDNLDRTLWCDQRDDRLVFAGPTDITNYGLTVLAGIAGDTVPVAHAV